MAAPDLETARSRLPGNVLDRPRVERVPGAVHSEAPPQAQCQSGLEAADAAGLAMVFTGMRHFRH